MIDCNHHVHNAAYLDMAREVLPEDADRQHFSQLEIIYKKEIRPGDTVLLEYGRDGGQACQCQADPSGRQGSGAQGKHYVMIRGQEDGALHAAIIMGNH